MTQGFAADTIFLGCEGKSHKGSGDEVSERTGEEVEAPLADPAANVLHAKKVISTGARATAILARAEKKIISKEKTISSSGDTRGWWLL